MATLHNFDIIINPPNTAGAYPLQVIDSPAGQSEQPTYQALPDQKTVEELLLYAQELVADTADMQALGQALFNFLFPPDIYRLFTESRSQLKEGEQLRIRLRWGDLQIGHDLGRLPWEYLYEPDAPYAGFLALSRKISLVRFLHGRPPISLSVPQTLKILAITSAPNGTAVLDLAAEVTRLQQAVSQAEKNNKIELTLLQNPTPRMVSQAIDQHKPHIFHYAGHAERGEKSGSLLLCDENGDRQRYPVSDLQVVLQDSSVRLAVLNGCETAAKPEQNDQAEVAIQSIAGQLIKAKLAAVIGMQYRIPDHIALNFLTALYQAIARDEPLDQAMTQARINLYAGGDDKNFWAIPALYLQVNDGRIFQQETRPAKDLITSVNQGFTALHELLTVRAVYDAILISRNDMVQVSHRLRDIRHYKQLHDKLQALETAFTPLKQNGQKLLDDPTAWIDLEIDHISLQEVVDQIGQVLKTSPTGSEEDIGSWPEMMRRGNQALIDGLEAQDRRTFNTGLRYIGRLLSKALPKLNNTLIENIKYLPLAQLGQNLSTVYDTALDTLSPLPQPVTHFAEGIGALEQLSTLLTVQAGQHDRWQDFDDDLRMVQANLKDDLFELELNWPDLQEKAAVLLQADQAWAKPLVKLATMVETTIDSKPVPVVINVFNKYRQGATRRFRAVDKQLLTLCADLERVSGPLTGLLQAMQSESPV